MAAAQNIETLNFTDIATGAMPDGFDRADMLARLHAKEGDEMLVGVRAFIALWLRLPKFKYLAHAINWPIMRGMTGLIYNRIIAPWLYRRYLRQQCDV
jgi:predicted DCC family thiol-disulfide oxidoreductase YuxK